MAGPRVNAFAGRSAHVNLREAHIHGWRSHMCADVVNKCMAHAAETIVLAWVVCVATRHLIYNSVLAVVLSRQVLRQTM